MDRRSLIFHGDGVALGAWLVMPEGDGPHPLVILIHGLSGIIDMDLENYAQRFVASGIACFAYDHRNWGRSSGWPRSETDPWRQLADLRDIIDFVRTLDGIDAERIGLWGTSYGGGHVLTASALDRRVRAAVAQVPLVSGSRTFDAWVPADRREAFARKLDADRDGRARGELPATTLAAAPESMTAAWVARNDTQGRYVNELTLRSFDLLRTYEPAAFAQAIAPTPLLLIVAENDVQTPSEWQLEMFENMTQPKRLLCLDCGHYDVYMSQLPQAAQAAQQWFEQHL